MSTNEELEQRVAKLEAEIAELRTGWRSQQRIGPSQPLGPRPLTLEEEELRRRRMQEIIHSAAAQLDKDTLKTAMDTADAAGDKEPIQTPPKMCTTNGKPVEEVRASQTNETGQHDGYIVLCPDERAKGFVRPYRDRYKHIGPKICGLHVGPDGGTVCYMDPGHEGPCGTATGPRPQACQAVTTMGRALSETYARDPNFYGATFCCGCNRHFPVGEFIWTVDGQVVGS